MKCTNRTLTKTLIVGTWKKTWPLLNQEFERRPLLLKIFSMMLELSA